MSQRLVTSFVNTVIPGAYANVTVTSQPVGLGASGVLVIMGEADGGPNYQTVTLANNSFAPSQLSDIVSTYTSGQIVDAFTALTSPSNDPNITNTANLIYVVKTNNSTKASAILSTAAASPATYGTIEDLNWGVNGNNYKIQVTELQSEVAPNLVGTTIPNFSAVPSASFTVRLNGGMATVVTVPSGSYSTGTAVAAAITDLLPSGMTASGDATTITLTVTADTYANANGWGKSFELNDSTPGDLAALGLTAGLFTSSAEPEVEVDVNNASTGLSETLDVVPVICLNVGYEGTNGTLTINATSITTTVTGGSGANLTIPISQYKTISDLASYIASQTGYSASVTSAATQLAPSALDQVSAIGICSTSADLLPGRIKNAAYAFAQEIGTSKGVQFVATAVSGLPATMSLPTYLAGGTRGATLAADIVNALAQIGGIQANIIVPLFSQDATEDIALGLTDSNSTYTIAAINAATKNHCIDYSTPELKRNRICVLSFWDNTENTYQNAKDAAQSLANYRCSLTLQQCMQVNSLGVITTFMPWYAAVVAAGMQAGGFYKAIVNKLANVISFVDPAGFDSGNPGDVEDALSAGLLFMNQLTSGDAWVSDQTTYGYDTNFVYNSMQAVYDADLIALDLIASFTAAFVGQSLADVSAGTALSYLSQKMNGYMRIKLIAPSDDAPAGYKNATVTISAPTMTVSVEIKLATAIYFIPINIAISAVQQQAG